MSTYTADLRLAYEALGFGSLGLRATSASEVYRLVGAKRKRRAYHPTALMHDALELLGGEWPFSCAGNRAIRLDDRGSAIPGRMDARVFARLAGANPIVLVNSTTDFGSTLLAGGYAEWFVDVDIPSADEFARVSAANHADVQALTKLAYQLRGER